MFEIPTNTADVIRENVVDAICKAMFMKKSLFYCDDGVYMDEEGGFRSYWNRDSSQRPSISFTTNERNSAFERIRAKGWYIEKESWCSSVNGHSLWAYTLKATN